MEEIFSISSEGSKNVKVELNARRNIWCNSCQRNHSLLEHFGVTELRKIISMTVSYKE